MKKKYEAPATFGIELAADEFLAASRLEGVTFDTDDAITDSGELLTRRQGWNSESWTSGK